MTEEMLKVTNRRQATLDWRVNPCMALPGKEMTLIFLMARLRTYAECDFALDYVSHPEAEKAARQRFWKEGHAGGCASATLFEEQRERLGIQRFLSSDGLRHRFAARAAGFHKQFALGARPIFERISRRAVALQINLVGAQCDLLRCRLGPGCSRLSRRWRGTLPRFGHTLLLSTAASILH